MVFATFLVQSEPHAASLRVVVIDVHADGRGDAGEAVDHDGDECPVSQADDGGAVNGVEQLAGFGRDENGGLAFLHDMFGASDGESGIERHDLSNDEEVEQRANRSQVEFDSRGTSPLRKLLDVSRDHDRGDLRQRDTMCFAPATELPDRLGVGCSCSGIPDLGGEEFEVSFTCS